QQEPRAHKVHKARRDQRVRPALPARKVLPEPREPRAHKDRRAILYGTGQAPRARVRASMGTFISTPLRLAYMVRRRRAHGGVVLRSSVQPAQRDHRATPEPREQQEQRERTATPFLMAPQPHPAGPVTTGTFISTPRLAASMVLRLRVRGPGVLRSSARKARAGRPPLVALPIPSNTPMRATPLRVRLLMAPYVVRLLRRQLRLSARLRI